MSPLADRECSSPRLVPGPVACNAGNKCATFPLQLLGYEVDTINTVQFSNHTGYPSFTGSVVSGDELRQLTDGLKANGLLLGHSHLLTGYIGSLSFLKEVSNLLKELRAVNDSVVHGELLNCTCVLGVHDTLTRRG